MGWVDGCGGACARGVGGGGGGVGQQPPHPTQLLSPRLPPTGLLPPTPTPTWPMGPIFMMLANCSYMILRAEWRTRVCVRRPPKLPSGQLACATFATRTLGLPLT